MYVALFSSQCESGGYVGGLIFLGNVDVWEAALHFQSVFNDCML